MTHDDSTSPEPGTTEWAQRILALVLEHQDRRHLHVHTVRICQICGRFGRNHTMTSARTATWNAAGYQCGRHGGRRELVDAEVERHPDRYCSICGTCLGPGKRRVCAACWSVWTGQPAEVWWALDELRGMAEEGLAPAELLGKVPDRPPRSVKRPPR